MKKLLISVVLFLILLSGVPVDKEFSLKDYYSGDYVFYTSSPVAEKCINLGACYMNFSEESSGQIIGESMTIQNFEPAAAIKELKAKVIKTEYLEDGTTIIYAYSNLIPKEVKVENEKINLQIAYYETYSVIGWPLILGSF